MSSQPVTRAYSSLEVKSFDATGRRFSGLATTPQTDRVGDVVEPLGAQFKNPLPLMLFHDSQQPVGSIYWGTPTKDGIPFTAEIPEVTEEGDVKRLTDKAAHFVKYKLIRAVSIGFRAFEDGIEVIKTGLRFTKWEGLETSLVPIPANAGAVINGSTIKSFDTLATLDRLADAGEPPSPKHNTAAPVASVRGVSIRPPKVTTMTYAEHIKATEAALASKTAELEAIQKKAIDEGRAKNTDEKEKFDALKSEITDLESELVDLREMESKMAAKAVPAAGGNPADASASRAGKAAPTPAITVSDNVPKGIGFARAVKASLVGRLDGRNPVEVAKAMYPSDTRLHAHLAHKQNLPNIMAHIKAAVPAATTTDTTWASALVDPTNLEGEFIEYLRPATIIGKLNLRRIPFNVRMIEQTQGGTGYWVGQGAPKPLTAFGYSPVTLGYTKVAAISVATEEAVRFSRPDLDMLIRDGLRDALVERIDRDLLDPAEAGTANVQPASLTNGLTALTSAGTSADNIRTDLGAIMNAFRSANLRGSIALVMPDTLAVTASLMANSLGQPEFPSLTGDGGTIAGIRVITSQYVANASGAGNMVVAIAENEVFLADDGQVTVDASREASLQMLDNPTNNSATATATTMVSMWQTNSIAFRAERFINWQKRRSDAVVYMDDVNWGSVGSPS